MNHIVLIGDSIFDNESYVSEGESVTAILSEMIEDKGEVTLLAVDGDVTTDVPAQLEKFPNTATHAFVSCGGNDALRVVGVLDKKAESVGDGLDTLAEVLAEFRINYRQMLFEITKHTKSLAVCTVYNSVPGISSRAATALALFNEIILEEAVSFKLPVIDLRHVCTEVEDYSAVSPIEPSGTGARKISQSICNMLATHNYETGTSAIYV